MNMSEDKQMELEARAARGIRVDRLRTIRLNDEEVSQTDADSESGTRSRGRPRPPIKSCCP